MLGIITINQATLIAIREERGLGRQSIIRDSIYKFITEVVAQVEWNGQILARRHPP
jgi:hypothetical protein